MVATLCLSAHASRGDLLANAGQSSATPLREAQHRSAECGEGRLAVLSRRQALKRHDGSYDQKENPVYGSRSLNNMKLRPRQLDVNAQPYVTFVTFFRNDRYTDDFEARVSRATRFLVRQLQRFRVDAEIILVEWNPPPGEALLIDSLGPLRQGGCVQVRGIIVSKEHHQRFRGAHEWGMHPAAAANVGLRRARGQFVSPKAADSYLSDEIVSVLARRDLAGNTMYRCDRHDVVLGRSELLEADDIALLHRLQSLECTPHEHRPPPPHWRIRDLHTNACGDFLLMSGALWKSMRGYPLNDTVLSLDCDSMIMHAAAARGVRESCLPPACRIYKSAHARLFANRITQVFSPWQAIIDNGLGSLRWWRLQTLARGAFNYPRRKVRGLESVLGPSIERHFVRPAERWAQGALPELAQPADWGLGEVALDERILCRAGWTATSSTEVA